MGKQVSGGSPSLESVSVGLGVKPNGVSGITLTSSRKTARAQSARDGSRRCWLLFTLEKRKRMFWGKKRSFFRERKEFFQRRNDLCYSKKRFQLWTFICFDMKKWTKSEFFFIFLFNFYKQERAAFLFFILRI